MPYYKYPPIYDCVFNRDLAGIKRLLNVERDGDVVLLSERDFRGRTPLHLASSEGHEDIVRFFVEVGADIKATDNKGATPLHHASTEAIARLFVDKGVNVNQTDAEQRTPLLYACEAERVDVALLLLSFRADANISTSDGTTPLHVASETGYEEVVKALVENGADVNARMRGGFGSTPLHIASAHGWGGVVRFLAEHGADVRATDTKEQTPLHFASAEYRADVALTLVELGAVINARNANGDTPLHLSSEAGADRVVQLLLEHGADASLVNDAGETPYDLASTAECIALLRPPSLRFIKKGDVALVKDATDPCVICYEDITAPKLLITACGHVFHRTCLKSWVNTHVGLATHDKCPMCRQTIITRHRPSSIVGSQETSAEASQTPSADAGAGSQSSGAGAGEE